MDVKLFECGFFKVEREETLTRIQAHIDVVAESIGMLEKDVAVRPIASNLLKPQLDNLEFCRVGWLPNSKPGKPAAEQPRDRTNWPTGNRATRQPCRPATMPCGNPATAQAQPATRQPCN